MKTKTSTLIPLVTVSSSNCLFALNPLSNVLEYLETFGWAEPGYKKGVIIGAEGTFDMDSS